MIELEKIVNLKMCYKDKNKCSSYEYINDSKKITYDENIQRIKFTLIAVDFDKEKYDVILIIENETVKVKTDLFDDASKLYRFELFKNKNGYILTRDFPEDKEVIYIHIELD